MMSKLQLELIQKESTVKSEVNKQDIVQTEKDVKSDQVSTKFIIMLSWICHSHISSHSEIYLCICDWIC